MRRYVAGAVGAAVLSLVMMTGAQAQPGATAADTVRGLASQAQSQIEPAHWRRCHWVRKCHWHNGHRHCRLVRRCW